MSISLTFLQRAGRGLLAALAFIALPISASAAPVAGQSEIVTWTCGTGSCPWGSPLSGHALVWPSATNALATRLGYQVSHKIYLPAARAEGMTISIQAGSASIYAGLPDGTSHRFLVTLGAGSSQQVVGLTDGEVVSVQASANFDYVIDIPDASGGTSTGFPASEQVSLTCTSSPCPWGTVLTTNAVVWPGSATPLNQRLGYTTSSPIYLPAANANVTTVEVKAGSASVYAGPAADPSHRLMATLTPTSGVFQVSGLASNEVLSVQSASAFQFDVHVGEPPPPPDPVDPPGGSTGNSGEQLAQDVVWSCTSSPCPWGSPLAGKALVWPGSLSATSARLGYTTSGGIYLPATAASSVAITILTGSATAYAGEPLASSHRMLGSASAGQALALSGASPGEVISIQSQGAFSYSLVIGNPPPPPPPPVDNSGALAADDVVWTCTSSPCPWGSPLTGKALAWPAEYSATSVRLGYESSKGIYIPAERAEGVAVTIVTGSAIAYAGAPLAPSQRILGTVSAGQTLTISGLAAGEVVSFQSGSAFTYRVAAGEAPPKPEGIVDAVQAFWYCNTSTCIDPAPWTSAVISWPSWAAYERNARTGNNSRTVYSASGELLYPYMGPWAHGCQVKAVSGVVLIIEWQRGTDVWRETWLHPGQAHTISLSSPEDGAMIESFDGAVGFSAQLTNCTPQPIR